MLNNSKRYKAEEEKIKQYKQKIQVIINFDLESVWDLLTLDVKHFSERIKKKPCAKKKKKIAAVTLSVREKSSVGNGSCQF